MELTNPAQANAFKRFGGTAAAVECQLLVVDEAGRNKTTEGAKPMILEATTAKNLRHRRNTYTVPT